MKSDNLKPCPYSKINFLSKLSVWWMNPIFTKGYKQKLKPNDLFEVAEKDKSRYLTNDLERNWEKEVEKANRSKTRPSFSRAFMKTYLWRFVSYGLFAVLCEISRCLMPLLIGELTAFFINHEGLPESYALGCAFGIAASAISAACFSQLYFTTLHTLGWNARTAVVGLMYKKTLKLSHIALGKTSTGKIVNLSSTDAIRYDFAFYFAHYLWLSPVECVVVTYLLWKRLGPAAGVGMSVLIVIMIVQSFIGKLFGKLRLKAAIATDQRVNIMSEVIAAMRVIKMYSWEISFHKIVTNLRKVEMRKIFFASLLRSFNYTATHSTGQTLSFVTFIVFAAIHGEITLEAVFVAVGLFSVMRVGVGVYFPLAMEKLFETKVALKRTEEFLLLPEIQSEHQKDLDKEKKGPHVQLNDFSGSWTKEGKATLSDVTFETNGGKLLVVVGPVGSGKSSLLSAILGELPALTGSASVCGKIAYSSQIPWLVSGTIRDNILFGEAFDHDRYNEVVRACALERDLAILPSGDETMVGARGVTLSGGQKARVGLARAAYSPNTEIALFDDPLSAVDPSVADHLFSECICGYMKEKVRILVTHQLHFLERADQILILKEGEVVGLGAFSELQAKGTDFSLLVKSQDNDDCLNPGLTDVTNVLFKPPSAPDLEQERDNGNTRISSPNDDVEEVDGGAASEKVALLKNDDVKVEIVKPSELKKEKVNHPNEDTNSQPKLQQLGFRSYYRFFKAGVLASYLIVMLAVILGNHVLLICSDWWLAQWAETAEKFRKHAAKNPSIAMPSWAPDPANNGTFSTTPPLIVTSSLVFDEHYYVAMYSILTAGFLLSMYIRTAMHFYLCVRSSIQLHGGMLSAILKAKIRFFDTNPVGAVLNRFSKDMNQVDELLPYAFMDVIFMWGCILAILIFVVSVNYFVVIIVLPMTVYFFYVRRYYVSTSREVKRIEGAKRSPVFGHLSSSLQGLVVIRTFRAQEEFTEKYHHLQDVHGSAWSAFVYGARWIAFRLDMVTSVFIGYCAFLSVALVLILPDDSAINAGNLGLTLTYSINLATVIQYSVRQSAEVENLMTSVERIYEYHDIPPESDDNDKQSVPSDWPSEGALSLVDVTFSYYKGGPKVLKNLSVEIKAKEKLGVVGRTGAGKSSLIASIFRMSDSMSGTITIDGIDTAQIKLHDLRSVLAIIPQDPVLFGATMRKNLDAFSTYTDEQLWSALEQVQLKSLVESLPMKLESKLSESGSNLSVGQRQLVCLARAILRNNRILIIDEATANVDLRTDHLIQETIRERFSHCTVITVAHRLNTIIHSDRILVLDNGHLVECDHPHVLLKNEESSFSAMIRMTGDQEQMLRESAEKAFHKHHMDDKE